MYALNDSIAPPAGGTAVTASRAALQTRPRIQRALIRSWEYIRPVRAAVLAIRLLTVLWLVILGAVLLSADNAWGWIPLAAAPAVLALSVWVFTTAARGWPAAQA